MDANSVSTFRNYFVTNDNSIDLEGLTPGNNYRITVEAEGTHISGAEVCRAVLVKAELQELLAKASKFMLQSNDATIQIKDMYRNKSDQYFKDIKQNKGHIMHKYRKDFNGGPGSPINGAIDGLFFNIWLDQNGKPPSQSPFGELRISLPLKDRITPWLHNVYFSDFYCHYRQHYVTLVVTERGSTEDKFCKKHLLELGLHCGSNPFFFYDNWKNAFFCSSKLKVEIFYCMDVDLTNAFARREGCNFYRVQIYGRGSSKPKGIPKNLRCNICNLN